MRRFLIAIAIVLVGLVALAAQLPASHAFGWLRNAVPALTGQQLEGTIWRGHAGRVAWDGYRLGSLDWTLDPLSIARGHMAMQLALKGREVNGQGTLRVALDGERLTGTDVSVFAPAAWLQVVLAEPFLQLDGMLVAELETIEFREGWLSELSGHSIWQDAVVSGRIVAPLGGLRVDWSTANDRILGRISDLGGPLSAAGRVVIENRLYSVDMQLSAPPEAIAIRQALYVIGRPDDEGSVRLRIEGPMLPIAQLPDPPAALARTRHEWSELSPVPQSGRSATVTSPERRERED